jgi:peptidoglycan/xylan/chitin deacetylase (PgdA/CDA1 family)
MWWLLGLGFGLLTLAHVAPFPFLLDWVSRGVSLWRVDTAVEAPAAIYLTFDDGPNPVATPALLDVLQRERAVATFFLIDRHVTEETAPIVRRMFDQGHGVALHSHTRRLMTLSPDDLDRTLDGYEARLEALTGRRPCAAFRPHAGWRGGDMIAGLRQGGRRLVGWGFMLWDWDWFRRPSAGRLVPRILKRVRAGSVVVLHDGHHEDPRADRRYTVETTARLIPALRQRGFVFHTICDVIAASPPPAPEAP